MRGFPSLLVLTLICLTPTRLWAGDEFPLDDLDGGTECDADGGVFIFCAPPPPPDAICREVLPVQNVTIPFTVEINNAQWNISFTAGPAPFNVQTPNDPITPSAANPSTQFLVMNVNAQETIINRGFPATFNGPVAPMCTWRGNASVMETRSLDLFPTGYLYSAAVSANYYIQRYYRDRAGQAQACPNLTLVATGYGGQEFYMSP